MNEKEFVNKEEIKSDLNLGLLAMAEEDLSPDDLLGYQRHKFKSIPQRIREVSKAGWVYFGIFIICLISILIVLVFKTIVAEKLIDQHVDERWADKGASQVSIFFQNNSKIDDLSIGTLRYRLVNNLSIYMDFEEKEVDEVEAHIKDVLGVEDISNEGELLGVVSSNKLLEGPYTYAYSAEGTISISSAFDPSNSINSAKAVGVGGDFFIFHPVKLYEGGRYFDDSEVMHDAVILDSNSAYKLFGSVDCIGQKVMINNTSHFVVGVYECDYSTYSKFAGSDGGQIFMYYDSLEKNGTTEGISCVEFVSIEPFKDYLYNFFADKSKSGLDDNVVVVSNSDRFRFNRLYSNVISVWGSRAMQTKAIVYPYWENIARAYENVFAVLLIVEWIFAAVAIVIVMGFIFNSIKNSDLSYKNISDLIEEKIEKYRDKRRKEKRRVDEKTPD